jgi:hypothetical protein
MSRKRKHQTKKFSGPVTKKQKNQTMVNTMKKMVAQALVLAQALVRNMVACNSASSRWEHSDGPVALSVI